MAKALNLAVVAYMLAACSGVPAASSGGLSAPATIEPTAATTNPTEAPTIAPVGTTNPTEAPTIAPVGTTNPTEAPTIAPAVTASPEAEFDLHGGQDSATAIAIAEGSLGMTMAQFIGNYNSTLDQDQYPISEAPEEIGDQVFQVTPDDTDNSTILFVTNLDGTIRSVTALSTAKNVSNELDRSFAQLESLGVWSTAAAAANPSLSEAEADTLLGPIGIEGGKDFGTYASSVDYGDVRYVLIETAEGTDLIMRPIG